jgi:eukaryotic-like serine/threonine-protein kinase
MPLDTVDSLVDALRSKPILRPDQLQQVLTKHAPAHTDTQALARTLIRLQLLTIYQAKKLISGKADELIVGQYLILDKLGEGGMGRVFKAVQQSLNRLVALKVVRNSLLKNETALKRFRREVRSAAQLSHPNIVRVFDADQVGGRHFLAMEYIGGVDLGKLVKDRGPLPIPMACSYVRQAALGLQHAHDRSMIHRDIKPANLLVGISDQGEYGVRNVVKILDMGLARFVHDESNESGSTELTRANTVVGTPEFMSPEQAKNARGVDHRSDLYSLGCTLYYLLSGEPPFPKGSPLEKLMQHQMDAPRPIQFLRKDVPGELAAIVHSLLAKRPEDRFQSGAAVAHAMEPWCAASPVAPSPSMVMAAEPVDPDSVTLETDPNDPFDFGDDEPIRVGPVSARRTPPTRTLPARPKPASKLLLPLVAVFLVFLLIGAVGVGVLLANRKKPEDSPPTKTEPPRTDRGEQIKPAPIVKVDPPPAKELEAVERFLPDDTSLAAVFDVKQLQASPVAKKVLLGPIADELIPFRVGFWIDLPSLIERAEVGARNEEHGGAIVVLQGRSLVTPRLIDALRSLAGRNASQAWEGGPDLFAIGPQPTFLATTETSILLSARRELVVEALEKVDDSKRTTKFADPTVETGFEALGRPAVQLAFFGRSAAIQIVMGVRQHWQKDLPGASQVKFLIGLVVFDDRGMHLHTLADESETGKAMDFVKTFGKSVGDLSRTITPADQRLGRIGHLLADAEPALKGPTPKRPFVHLVSTVPARRLEDWFAPFLPNKTDR